MYDVRRGPLVYALKIGEEKTMLEYERDGVERKFPYCDWEYRPTTDWQYAFASEDVKFHEEGKVGNYILNPKTLPHGLKFPYTASIGATKTDSDTPHVTNLAPPAPG